MKSFSLLPSLCLLPLLLTDFSLFFYFLLSFSFSIFLSLLLSPPLTSPPLSPSSLLSSHFSHWLEGSSDLDWHMTFGTFLFAEVRASEKDCCSRFGITRRNNIGKITNTALAKGRIGWHWGIKTERCFHWASKGLVYNEDILKTSI